MPICGPVKEVLLRVSCATLEQFLVAPGRVEILRSGNLLVTQDVHDADVERAPAEGEEVDLGVV